MAPSPQTGVVVYRGVPPNNRTTIERESGPVLDPFAGAEVFCDGVGAAYMHNGVLHLTLTVSRAGEPDHRNIRRVVIARLVMPTLTAAELQAQLNHVMGIVRESGWEPPSHGILRPHEPPR